MKATTTLNGLTVTLDCDDAQWSNAQTALVAQVLNEDRWIGVAGSILHNARHEEIQENGQTPEESATGILAGRLSQCFAVTGANFREISDSLINMAINAQ